MSINSFLRKKICIPLWVAKDRSPRLRYLKEMEKSQYYDIEDLKERQFNRFKELILYAYKHTVHFRNKFDESGINPNNIKDHNDINKLPVLTKKEIQDNFNDLVSDKFDKKNLIPFKTGGSTGKSITVLKDFITVEHEVGCAFRAFRWAGWEIGEPWGRIWGNPQINITLKEKLRNLLISPEIYLDTMKMNDEAMFEFTNQWKKCKPSILHGHSHSIFIFAQYCGSHGIKDIKPKGIISTSMMLLPSERKAIEKVFECKVTDLYGGEEVALIGSECEQHKGMHLNIENVYVEFIDSNGNCVPYGQQGAIIVTSLLNKAMPLIRYKIEDVGIPSKEKCKCGRSLPIMQGISGRVADFLVRKDGSLVAGVSLVERTLTAIPGVIQMQIIQEDMDNIFIKIVKDDSYDIKSENELLNEIKSSLGKHINVHLDFVNIIKPELSGKYRFAISKVKNPYFNI